MTPAERAAYDAETDRMRAKADRSQRIAETLALCAVLVQLSVLVIRIGQAFAS